MFIGMSNAFRGVFEQKATGLGAVAGVIAEGYVTFGVIPLFVVSMAVDQID